MKKLWMVNSLDGFDSSYGKLFGPLLRSGVTPHPNDWLTNSLRETYKKISCGGNDVGSSGRERVTCLQCPEVGLGSCPEGEAAVVMETKSDYNLLKSVEILGNTYAKERLYQDAYNCYKLACSYYAERFDPTFVKCREMKKKMARVLLEWGQFDAVIEELKSDARVEAYGTAMDADCTLYIKYAYGLSLVSKNLSLEALPYLSQFYLAQMDTENSENMEVLNSIIQLAMLQLSQSRVEFAMFLAKRMLNIFSIRLQRCDCPVEIFDFAAVFSSELLKKGCGKELISMYSRAYELHAMYGTQDTSLMVNAIGCSFSEETQQFKECLQCVVQIHSNLLSLVTRSDAFILRRLRVTTKLVYIWSGKDEAVKILVDTYNHVSEFLEPNDPNYKFFWDCANGRLWSED